MRFSLSPLGFQLDMVNFSAINFPNATKVTSTEGDTANVTLDVSYIITIIINSITCPFTVLLNVLVIMAVKRRPRLQTNSNILLACLAATDALTGLIVQPLFILWKLSQLLGVSNSEGFHVFHSASLRTVIACSSLHVMLVTFKRLLAIKFTMNYLNVITEKNIKIAVTLFWIIALSSGVYRLSNVQLQAELSIIAVLLVSCIIFVVFSYMILYRETRRHQKTIKTRQLPQEDVERFTKENKALKTTVFVVCAVIFCLLPAGVVVVLVTAGLSSPSSLLILDPWVRTAVMLNSLLNPLIYCWRQKEMRKFVFKRTQVMPLVNLQ